MNDSKANVNEVQSRILHQVRSKITGKLNSCGIEMSHICDRMMFMLWVQVMRPILDQSKRS
jgi:hypothetical protein